MARKSDRTSLWKKLLWVAVVMTTGGGGAGLGTLQLNDMSLTEAVTVAQKFVGLAAEGGDLKQEILKEVTSRLESGPGVYRVSIAELKLDERPFKEGKRVNLRVVVRKKQGDDPTRPLWDSARFGEQIARVGEDPLKANWKDRPFEVEWRPGDRMVVEVWDGSGFRASKLLVLETPADAKGFPLRSGKQALTVKADGSLVREEMENSIAFETERVGDLPSSTEVAQGGSRGDRSTR